MAPQNHLMGHRQLLDVDDHCRAGRGRAWPRPIRSVHTITWASLGSFLSQPLCKVSRLRARQPRRSFGFEACPHPGRLL